MVNVIRPKTQLSRRFVVIARNGDPVARLVGLEGTRGTRRFGALRDRIVVDGRFPEPLPESELARWESSAS